MGDLPDSISGNEEKNKSQGCGNLIIFLLFMLIATIGIFSALNNQKSVSIGYNPIGVDAAQKIVNKMKLPEKVTVVKTFNGPLPNWSGVVLNRGHNDIRIAWFINQHDNPVFVLGPVIQAKTLQDYTKTAQAQLESTFLSRQEKPTQAKAQPEVPPVTAKLPTGPVGRSPIDPPIKAQPEAIKPITPKPVESTKPKVEAQVEQPSMGEDTKGEDTSAAQSEQPSTSVGQPALHATEQPPADSASNGQDQTLTREKSRELLKQDIALLDKTKGLIAWDGIHGSKPLYIFIDPDCMFCHRLYKIIKDNTEMFNKADVTPIIVPVSILNRPDGPGKAAAIIKGGFQAYVKDEENFNSARETGGVTPISGDDAAPYINKVKFLSNLMHKITTDGMSENSGTPMLVWRAGNGTPYYLIGQPNLEGLGLILKSFREDWKSPGN